MYNSINWSDPFESTYNRRSVHSHRMHTQAGIEFAVSTQKLLATK